MAQIIRLGGLGVIVCVLGIMVYLIAVVRPLFGGASTARVAEYQLLSAEEAANLVLAQVDEYRVLGAWLDRDGEAGWFAARSGEILGRERLFAPEPRLSAWCGPRGDGAVALGFADGSVRLGRLGFSSTLEPTADPPAGVGSLRAGPAGVVEQVTRTEGRRVAPALSLEPPISLGEAGDAVALLDYRPSANEDRLAVLTAGGQLVISTVTRRSNLMTGETSSETDAHPVPLPAELARLGPPAFLRVTSKGDQLYLAWSGGEMARFDLRDAARPSLAERTDLVPSAGATLTAFDFMFGEQSLLSGDSLGILRAWFRVEHGSHGEDALIALAGESPSRRSSQTVTAPHGSLDGFVLVPAHRLAGHAAALTALASSRRDKSIVSGDAQGELLLHHMTSEQVLTRVRLSSPAALVETQIAPKGDGLFALAADGRAALWELRNPHPETTVASLFDKIWYEGAPAPAYSWQSSSGTDDFEPKLSLVPLIFGSIKATFYAMLFAVPVALLAAIYTSEFLDRKLRGPLKTVIELMASLPSVVLGFLAALVLAPLIENVVVAVLTAFALVPLTVLGLGYAIEVLPPAWARMVAGKRQVAALLLAVVVALAAAPALASALERLLFAGDFKAWLGGDVGKAAPGIAVLLAPVCLVALLILDRRVLIPVITRRAQGIGRETMVWLELGKFIALVVAALGLAAALGALGGAAGLDARGTLVGTYVQRNALVVGFAMGFAVIPIIYTLAEDALAAVPHTLRSASLGCGATRWQTATRVVLPVAFSGILSALMIGLGRAVGETMIVLMAAGNTPVLELNVFTGLRTLSANIAVELPEAVKDGTLFRTLFLAALCLFFMTFVVNTLAELVRQRYRRRAAQL